MNFIMQVNKNPNLYIAIKKIIILIREVIKHISIKYNLINLISKSNQKYLVNLNK